MLVTLYKIGEVYFRCLVQMVFMQRQRLKDLLLRAHVVRTSKMEISRHLVDYVKNCTEKRAARLYFLIQPSNHLFVVLPLLS